MSKSMKDLCEMALNVQNAVNLVAIVKSYDRALEDLRDLGIDRSELASHPVSVLFASKIASLTNSEDTATFSKAYNEAMDIVEGK